MRFVVCEVLMMQERSIASRVQNIGARELEAGASGVSLHDSHLKISPALNLLFLFQTFTTPTNFL